MIDAVHEALHELAARGVEISPMVSGESPRERQPRQSGCVLDEGQDAALGDVRRGLERGRDRPEDREQADEGPEREGAVDRDARDAEAGAVRRLVGHCVSPWVLRRRRLKRAMIRVTATMISTR